MIESSNTFTSMKPYSIQYIGLGMFPGGGRGKNPHSWDSDSGNGDSD